MTQPLDQRIDSVELHQLGQGSRRRMLWVHPCPEPAKMGATDAGRSVAEHVVAENHVGDSVAGNLLQNRRAHRRVGHPLHLLRPRQQGLQIGGSSQLGDPCDSARQRQERIHEAQRVGGPTLPAGEGEARIVEGAEAARSEREEQAALGGVRPAVSDPQVPLRLACGIEISRQLGVRQSTADEGIGQHAGFQRFENLDLWVLAVVQTAPELQVDISAPHSMDERTPCDVLIAHPLHDNVQFTAEAPAEPDQHLRQPLKVRVLFGRTAQRLQQCLAQGSAHLRQPLGAQIEPLQQVQSVEALKLIKRHPLRLAQTPRMGAEVVRLGSGEERAPARAEGPVGLLKHVPVAGLGDEVAHRVVVLPGGLLARSTQGSDRQRPHRGVARVHGHAVLGTIDKEELYQSI